MGRKKKIKREDDGIVYSTNPGFSLGDLLADALNEEKPDQQMLEAHFEKKGRGGKTAVVIKGFQGSEEELKSLAKELKVHCGVGGTAKDGEIIIQGNVRDKAMDYLQKAGHKVKRVGG